MIVSHIPFHMSYYPLLNPQFCFTFATSHVPCRIWYFIFLTVRISFSKSHIIFVISQFSCLSSLFAFHFSFQTSHFSFLISHFPFLISHFSCLISKQCRKFKQLLKSGTSGKSIKCKSNLGCVRGGSPPGRAFRFFWANSSSLPQMTIVIWCQKQALLFRVMQVRRTLGQEWRAGEQQGRARNHL